MGRTISALASVAGSLAFGLLPYIAGELGIHLPKTILVGLLFASIILCCISLALWSYGQLQSGYQKIWMSIVIALLIISLATLFVSKYRNVSRPVHEDTTRKTETPIVYSAVLEDLSACDDLQSETGRQSACPTSIVRPSDKRATVIKSNTNKKPEDGRLAVRMSKEPSHSVVRDVEHHEPIATIVGNCNVVGGLSNSPNCLSQTAPVAPNGRHVNGESAVTAIESLKHFEPKYTEIAVVCFNNDNESCQYADEIVGLLNKGGWKAILVAEYSVSPPPGLNIIVGAEVRTMAGGFINWTKLPRAAAFLSIVFVQSAIPAQIRGDTTLPKDMVMLYVGPAH